VVLGSCLLVLPGLAAAPSLGSGALDCELLAGSLERLESLREDYPEQIGTRLDASIGNLSKRYADLCVRLNHLQVLGSHNSYHIQPEPDLFDLLLFFEPSLFVWEYNHLPLEEQFSFQGIRQIELDLFHDPDGGYHANPIGLQIASEDPDIRIPHFEPPGLKVFHVQELDFQTTCPTFVGCLEVIRDWSDANPGHLPITVLLELKDDVIPDPGFGFRTPLPFDAAALDGVDAEIRSVFREKRLITPDAVRGGRETLEEAILEDGWPTLRDSRGKILFLMDNGGEKRALYREGHPSLAGRVIFTNANPGDPDAAFVKRNSPVGNEGEIADLVADGYLVRTRADADTIQAREDDPTQRDAALASGAQFVSTDYPVPNPDFGTDYFVEIPGGMPAACNPINAPPGCRNAWLERLSH
jgi:hypothetical protein